tara:strand:+ start:5312 stop:5548 length:237 start_codon:yes stop_codon:yes gene_type:complete
MKKITKKELDILQVLVNKINQGQFNIGSIEIQKKNVINEVQSLINDMQEQRAILSKKYGNKEINVMTGELVDLPNASN